MMKFCFWYIFEFLPSKGKVATFGKLWFPDSRDTLSAGGGGFYEVSSNKDGSSNTVKEDGSGEQFETGSSGKLYGKFTETVTTKKILEVKQIKALLFFKKSAGDSETYKAEDYYEIPLDVEK